MPKKKDLYEERFGRLVAVRVSGKYNGKYIWECMCDCGNVVCVEGSKLTNGHTKSCGCLRRDGTKKAKYSHGLCKTRLYRIWSNIKTRCLNHNVDNFKYYGGRGITICDEWRDDFQSFYDWAIANGYKEGLTIERKDSDGNYSPQNCEWITLSENATRANNKRWAVRACRK